MTTIPISAAARRRRELQEEQDRRDREGEPPDPPGSREARTTVPQPEDEPAEDYEEPKDKLNPHGFEFVQYEAFGSMDFGRVRWLVDDLIPSSGCGFLAGLPKMGKTWLALDLLLAVSSGDRFLGRPVTQGRAAYLGGEGGPSRLQQRLDWLVNGRRLAGCASVFNKNLYVGLDAGLHLDRPEGLSVLRRQLDKIRPSLMIIDPFTRFHARKENERDSIEPMLTLLRQLSETYNTFILVVHHSPKPRAGETIDPLRGSSALRAWHDVLIWLEKDKEGSLMVKAEARDSEEPPELGLIIDINKDLRWAKLDYEIDAAPKSAQSGVPLKLRIEQILLRDESSTPSRLAQELKVRRQDVQDVLLELERDGRIVWETIDVVGRDKKTYRKKRVRLKG